MQSAYHICALMHHNNGYYCPKPVNKRILIKWKKIKLINWVSSKCVNICFKWAQWEKKTKHIQGSYELNSKKRKNIYSKIPNAMRALNLKESSKIKCVILLPFWRVKATSSLLYTLYWNDRCCFSFNCPSNHVQISWFFFLFCLDYNS